MTWECTIEPLDAGRSRRCRLRHGGSAASYADVIRGWHEDAACRAYFVGLLADAPFAAYRWETPPVTTQTAGRPFEFVLLDAPELARPPDARAFARHVDHGGGDAVVATFPNLGNDAVLVVPRRVDAVDPVAYVHLAAFVRRAPAAQRHAFWRAVGAAVASRLSAEPVWVSTAGMGVAWLHVRLDDRPKYYGHAAYREAGR